jgi:hypothetical protein
MFERSGRFWRCAFELNPRQIERILHPRDVPLELPPAVGRASMSTYENKDPVIASDPRIAASSSR